VDPLGWCSSLHFGRWFSSFSWWEIFKTGTPIAISFTALSIVLFDRRPRLSLKSRKGKWYTLTPTMSSGEVIFKGIVEVYNASSRANAIRGYHFRCKLPDGTWKDMDSERYKITAFRSGSDLDEPATFNETPLSLAPYSGAEVPVQAIVKMPRPYELPIIVEVKDLFGKKYRVEVTAIS
jgi:hypothetical protein